MLDINTIEIIRKIFERWPKRFVDVLNSLNEKQQVSKDWLVEKLNDYKYPFRHKLKKDRISIMLLCSWYGMLAYKLIQKFSIKKIDRIYCVDFDPKSKMIGNRLFRKIDNENLQKGILTQVNFRDKDIKDLTKEEMSNCEIIINTSCEHLEQQIIYDNLDKCPSGTLIVLQSNNYHKIQEHINTVKDLHEFVSQYQSHLINIQMYEKDFLDYKRFMIIGIKR